MKNKIVHEFLINSTIQHLVGAELKQKQKVVRALQRHVSVLADAKATENAFDCSEMIRVF